MVESCWVWQSHPRVDAQEGRRRAGRRCLARGMRRCGHLRRSGGQPTLLPVAPCSATQLPRRGRNCHRELSPLMNIRYMWLLAGHCQCARAIGLSVPRNGLMVRVESQLRAAGLSAEASEGSGEVWCGLCGDRRGWCTCGRCMGEGGFPTRPGLSGLKGKVGWARCKTCFGQTVVPCLFCGISEATNPVQAWARTCQATSPSKPQAV